jgi:hypothetical protein
MAAPNRPKRVVVVDAENPLVEVQGEFFWREDHEALVAAARQEAYRSGYQSGWSDAAPPSGWLQVRESRLAVTQHSTHSRRMTTCVPGAS